MSEEKRAQLIAEGRMHPDGTRIELCPYCRRELPEGFTPPEPGPGDAVAVPEAAELGVTDPAAPSEEG